MMKSRNNIKTIKSFFACAALVACVIALGPAVARAQSGNTKTGPQSLETAIPKELSKTKLSKEARDLFDLKLFANEKFVKDAAFRAEVEQAFQQKLREHSNY